MIWVAGSVIGSRHDALVLIIAAGGSAAYAAVSLWLAPPELRRRMRIAFMTGAALAIANLVWYRVTVGAAMASPTPVAWSLSNPGVATATAIAVSTASLLVWAFLLDGLLLVLNAAEKASGTRTPIFQWLAAGPPLVKRLGAALGLWVPFAVVAAYIAWLSSSFA